jgi:hypothetical protein
MVRPGKVSVLVSPKMAEAREIEIKEFCDSKADYIASNNVRFGCRVYGDAPFMHGFLVDDQVLFMGLCSHDGTAWTTSPYIHFVKSPEDGGELDGAIGTHFIKVFNNWFDARWKNANARTVWLPAQQDWADAAKPSEWKIEAKQ